MVQHRPGIKKIKKDIIMLNGKNYFEGLHCSKLSAYHSGFIYPYPLRLILGNSVRRTIREGLCCWPVPKCGKGADRWETNCSGAGSLFAVVLYYREYSDSGYVRKQLWDISSCRFSSRLTSRGIGRYRGNYSDIGASVLHRCLSAAPIPEP